MIARATSILSIGILIIGFFCAGCGTTRDKLATQQLLLSDAVDRAVARIDFSPLRGEKVYLDTTYVRQVKSDTFVNADYIISSLRQQLLLAGCFLQDDREQADYIAEARVGVLGTDGHDVNYGVPGNQGISAAANLVSGSAPIPALPEISLARKADDTAAAKIAVFAYHRLSKEPIWQSGLSVAKSRAQAKWVLGAGPFQTGSIYNGTRFAGDSLLPTPLNRTRRDTLTAMDEAYRSPAVWSDDLQEKLRAKYDPAYIAAQEATAEGDASVEDSSQESAVQTAAASEAVPEENDQR